MMRFVYFCLFFSLLQGGFFREDMQFRKSSLVEQQQKFYHQELSQKVTMKELELLSHHLTLQARPFFKQRAFIQEEVKFYQEIIALKKKVNSPFEKILLTSLELNYKISQPKEIVFEQFKKVTFSSPFISYLAYKSFFSFYQYFPKENFNTYQEKYYQSVLDLIKLESKDNERVLFQELSFFIKNHLAFLDKDKQEDFREKLKNLPQTWLQEMTKMELAVNSLEFVFPLSKKSINISHFRGVERKHYRLNKDEQEKLRYWLENFLQKTKEKKLPEMAELLMRLEGKYLGNFRREFVVLFRLGVEQEFDYLPLYTTYLRYLNFNDKTSFFLECFETQRFDTFVPSLLWLDRFLGNFFDEDFYDKVWQGYEDSPQNYYKDDKKFFLSYLFHSMFNKRNYSYVSKIAKRINFDIFDFPQAGWRKSIKEKIGYIEAVQQTQNYIIQDLYEDIDWSLGKNLPQERDNEEIEGLLGEINRIKETNKLTSNATYVVNILQDVLKIEQSFRLGKWIDLTFDKDLSLWRIFRGNFSYKDKNTVIGSSNFIDKWQYLSHRSYFLPPYELEATIRPLENHLSSPLPAGIIIGKMQSKVHGRYFFFNQQENYGGIYNPYKPNGVIPPTNLANETQGYKLRVKIYKDKFRFWINNQEVKRYDKDGFASLLVSFGVIPLGVGKVEYKNIRIRSLKEK